MSKSANWILTAGVAGVIGFVATSLLPKPSREQSSSQQASREPSPPSPGGFVDPLPADLNLPPAGVVEAQMQALEKCQQDTAAIRRVYAFASPGNKSVTGPLPRFEKMVWRAPYSNLIINRGWTVGKAVMRDNYAAVLVTAVDRDGGLWAFRFYLSRQMTEPSKRWMTDGVFVVGSPSIPTPNNQSPESLQGSES